MKDSYQIDLIVCNNKREFNKYSRTYGGQNSTTIDYITITNKLIKSNFHETIPHPLVIGVAIQNAFSNVFNKTEHDRIIYMVKDLDYELVDNFKSMISETLDDIVEDNEIYVNYNLVYINRCDNFEINSQKENVHCEFNSIDKLKF
tara:strand:+ start:201 stop:638 length:438 start_codon:yes stop_codon:yes gene_type:complete